MQTAGFLKWVELLCSQSELCAHMTYMLSPFTKQEPRQAMFSMSTHQSSSVYIYVQDH